MADIPLGTRAAVKDVVDDLKECKPNWLKKSAEKIAAVTVNEWEMRRGRMHSSYEFEYTKLESTFKRLISPHRPSGHLPQIRNRYSE